MNIVPVGIGQNRRHGSVRSARIRTGGSSIWALATGLWSAPAPGLSRSPPGRSSSGVPTSMTLPSICRVDLCFRSPFLPPLFHQAARRTAAGVAAQISDMFSVARSAQWVSSLPNSALSSSGVIRPSARACPITANTSDGDARYICGGVAFQC